MKVIVDFHRIPERQQDMHRRLENWAAYVAAHARNPRAPMWRYTRSNARMWHMPEPVRIVDSRDGFVIERAVSHLPVDHRAAIRWHYVYKGPAARIARQLGVSYDTLARLVIDARFMLINCGDDKS